jgi:hypothetical protein
VGGLSLLGLVGIAGVLAGAARIAARLPWRLEAQRERAADGSPVSQLELRVARRAGAAPGWRLYCSIVLARGQDRPSAAILSGQPPVRGL